MSSITINGNVLKLDARERAITLNAFEGALPASHSIGKKHIIIKSQSALTDSQKKDLIDSKVKINSYVDDNTYLCFYEDGDLEELRGRSYLDYVDVYQDFFKIHPNLKKEIPAATRTMITDNNSAAGAPPAGVPVNTEIRVIIGLHANTESLAEQIVGDLVNRKIIERENTQIYGRRIDTVVLSKDLGHLAAIDSIQMVHEQYDEELEINVARTILNHPVEIEVLDPITMLNVPVDCAGAGQVIHIADSGFDKGLMTDVHPAFAPINGVNRLLDLRNPTGASFAPLYEDDNSHGTHVAGCALGNGSSTTMGGATSTEPGFIKGTAPSANFVVTRVVEPVKPGKPLSIWSGKVEDLLDEPYHQYKARVSNHSYGPAVKKNGKQLPYDVKNILYDDYLFDKSDLLVCWSGGNSGNITNPISQVNGLSCCKNVITIANCLNARRIVGKEWDPIHALSDGDLYTFWRSSSRGPTEGGRRKPDVCAPGTAILSTLSRECAAPTGLGASTDKNYCFKTGTSMAAPLVSGCAAVLREVLSHRGVPNPSAALIKVLLIHGAVDLFRGVTTTVQAKPENLQGFGRVNMGGSINAIEAESQQDLDKKVGGFIDAPDMTKQAPALAQDHINYVTVQVDAKSQSRTLKATLTWNDHGGDTLSIQLGLAITVESGERRHGNMETKNMMTQPDTYDVKNNVHQIVWEDVPAGQANISVKCIRTLNYVEVAAYALAWSLE